ncbi:transmembrane and death domain protein 1 [Sceloporus undulatus]|uniref:transmembrane and death domain protein 1 n=1 Tax=Sceloporus undulatus TaxID=8520 RepID=UPI001C4CFFA6|nr:transmembrane and death domain protein 1 [Sceloporus undulatus]
MLSIVRVILLLLVAPALSDDTVADDIGIHMMSRISELLSPEECQMFTTKLLGPEEDVKEELEWLSEEKNPIGARRRRDIISTDQCKEALNRWLLTEGDTMYWDRLSRALQDIGRSDVSIELGKNLNQDKNLEIKKNVEEYHETVKHLTSSLLLDENEIEMGEKQKTSRQGRPRHAREDAERKRKLRKLEELELLVQRKPLPPYDRSLFAWISPVTRGAISGFLTPLILVSLAIYTFLWILNQGRPEHTTSSWDKMTKIIHSSPTQRYYTLPQHYELEELDSESEVEDNDYGDSEEDSDNEEDD